MLASTWALVLDVEGDSLAGEHLSRLLGDGGENGARERFHCFALCFGLVQVEQRDLEPLLGDDLVPGEDHSEDRILTSPTQSQVDEASVRKSGMPADVFGPRREYHVIAGHHLLDVAARDALI